MTEEQKKKYEEKAWEHFPDVHPDESWHTQRQIFIGGCEHAHPIAHSEGKKEGWNEALDEAVVHLKKYLKTHNVFTPELLLQELKRLKR